MCAKCARACNPINMGQNLESCKRPFDVILEKLVATKHFTLSVGNECKEQYALFLSTSVKDEGVFLMIQEPYKSS